jgi:radical SAM superfamily enzyme YgiQ (UPF0313 family)
VAAIVLATINARYSHAALGLRYLKANLAELAAETVITEFTLETRIEVMAERILAHEPTVLGLGIYIWNVDISTRLVAMLRTLAPQLLIVLGGPEVSHEAQSQRICAMAHHVISGSAETEFTQLCRQLLKYRKGEGHRPLNKFVVGGAAGPRDLRLPYELYTDEDIAHRNLYVEASRGCPFTCEFCLSALDKTAVAFDLDAFLVELDRLWQRGARRFKFVDRTFNLRIDNSRAILQFFLDRLTLDPDRPTFAHFELVPDHLPERLRELIQRFPPDTLQFEIGIQTFNPAVQTLISRRQNNEKAADNIAWLAQETHAHLHIDLIAGLPGEDIASFAEGFNKLVALGPQDIQVGILKRLRGAPIARHTEAFQMLYNPEPPYNVLATDRIPFKDMQALARFARYWDLVGNADRFRSRRAELLAHDPFARFMAFSEWLYANTDSTWRIAADRLAGLLDRWLLENTPEISPSGLSFHNAPPPTDSRRRWQKRHPSDRSPGRPA